VDRLGLDAGALQAVRQVIALALRADEDDREPVGALEQRDEDVGLVHAVYLEEVVLDALDRRLLVVDLEPQRVLRL
jgi:hypothetical protein